MKRFLTAVLLVPIRAYQRWISPGLPRRCKYEPTCSDYAVEAIGELGPARGMVLAAWRLLRCNPLSDGGIDDLADRRLFRDTPHRSEQPAAHAHRRGRSRTATSEGCDATHAGTGASA
ncbi:MAG TPA: membrane protein insertion efficiency factor YidD [Solirubrobacterales bacterium]|nr:membrane protein insertion efficiency factor YidD [Solirubrobacterales bacterium]